MPKFNFPEFHRIDFVRKDESRWFDLSAAPVGFNRLPADLTIEERQLPVIQAPKIIRGRQEAGKYLFFTGIRPTPHPLVWFGDHRPGKVRKSIIVFCFAPNGRSFTAYYFRSFYVSGEKRERFLAEFIRRFQNDLL